jgi:serine kinase of HPr protein (carbohydrate metabolism regulator)
MRSKLIPTVPGQPRSKESASTGEIAALPPLAEAGEDERTASATVHASAVLVGARAVLVRGPSGAGKSRLALDLIQAGRTGSLPFARLVADDRVHLEAVGGRLLARPAEALAGLLEVRGAGIVRIVHEPCAVVGLVVDLAAADAERLPRAETRETEVASIKLPRLAVADSVAALPLVLSLITSSKNNWT